VATNGWLYRSLVGNLKRYPIPPLSLPRGQRRRLLDIGCGWGRWSLAAARLGYTPVGMDPSLETIRAARRVAEQLGIRASYLIGDARYLPFTSGAFDAVFSYAVLQHLSKVEVRQSVNEIARTLKEGGTCYIQLPNSRRLRSLLRRALGKDRSPERLTAGKGMSKMVYYTLSELTALFGERVGPPSVSAECYLGLDIQMSDLDLLPPRYKPLVCASTALRWISRRFPPLVRVADSVMVKASRQG
jgi:SAM-dependent methyltransferase